jgi:hypothetical protein
MCMSCLKFDCCPSTNCRRFLLHLLFSYLEVPKLVSILSDGFLALPCVFGVTICGAKRLPPGESTNFSWNCSMIPFERALSSGNSQGVHMCVISLRWVQKRKFDRILRSRLILRGLEPALDNQHIRHWLSHVETASKSFLLTSMRIGR